MAATKRKDTININEEINNKPLPLKNLNDELLQWAEFLYERWVEYKRALPISRNATEYSHEG